MHLDAIGPVSNLVPEAAVTYQGISEGETLQSLIRQGWGFRFCHGAEAPQTSRKRLLPEGWEVRRIPYLP
jgi:hypothetical protein